MFREIKYVMSAMPGHEDAIARMGPSRLLGIFKSVGEFTTLVDDPETRRRFLAKNAVEGYGHSWFELYFRFNSEEVAEASMFQIMCRRNNVELTFDEKTAYDERGICPHCGKGRVQLGPMVVPQLAKRRPPPFFLIAGGQFLATKEFAKEIAAIAPGVKWWPVFATKRAVVEAKWERESDETLEVLCSSTGGRSPTACGTEPRSFG